MELFDIISAIDIEPYYSDEYGVIYNADCLDVMKQMPDGCVDLVVTDPPYNEVNQSSNGLRNLDKGKADSLPVDLDGTVLHFLRCCSQSLYIFCGDKQISRIRILFESVGLTLRCGYWEKDNPSPMNGKHIYLSACENVIWGKYAGAVFNGFCLKPIWHAPVVTNQIHPTQKPLSIISDMVCVGSNEGAIVFDPFMGSGTTCVAAQRLNRKFIGIEINKQYCEIAVKRLAQRELFT